MSRKRTPRHIPEQIDDTPENIAQAILTTPPREDNEWAYLEGHTQQPSE